MNDYTANNAISSATTEQPLIPVFLGSISSTPAYVCDARTLHSFLEVGKRFASWIQERIEEYGFIENQDFSSFSQNGEKPKGGRPSTEYHLSLDMAKELSMVERNEKGREARRYFIDCERRALAAAGQVVLPAHTDTLLPSEQQTLSEIVHHKAASVPAELIGKALAEIWSRVHRKFRVSQYAQLPRTQLSDAICYVMKMELKTKAVAAPDPFIPLTSEQALTIKTMAHEIGSCCHFKRSASEAVAERLRFQFALRGVSELGQGEFVDATTELERLMVLSEAHHERMCALDEEFIESVLRPAVSIRKIRAMLAKRPELARLTF